MPICRMPGTAICAGEPTAKCGNSTSCIPNLGRKSQRPVPTRTIGAPVEHLDLATVIKVSQAVSGEIVLEKLIETLMRTAIEHAGAERASADSFARGLSPGSRRKPPPGRHGSRAAARRARDRRVLPETVLHYVLRTQESVILDDAADLESRLPPIPTSVSATPAPFSACR